MPTMKSLWTVAFVVFLAVVAVFEFALPEAVQAQYRGYGARGGYYSTPYVRSAPRAYYGGYSGYSGYYGYYYPPAYYYPPTYYYPTPPVVVAPAYPYPSFGLNLNIGPRW